MRKTTRKYIDVEIAIIIGWLCIGLGMMIKVFPEKEPAVEESEAETEYEKMECIVVEEEEKTRYR